MKEKSLQPVRVSSLPNAVRPAGLALTLGVFVALFAGCAVPQPRGAGKLERIVEPTTERGYWLYLPKEYIALDESARSARRWPLVVTFHGMKPFDGARAQAREWQQEADRYGFVVAAPELRAFHVLREFPLRTVNAAFQSDEEAALAILEHIFQTTDASPGDVLSTSWSSGGYLAHYMLNRHPGRFTCLAVRQSNFSHSVLDPDLARRSAHHPILIVNTQGDFAICRRESEDAIRWYETHGYRNNYWVLIKDKGHVRTPELAAEFFARVAGVQPNSPPSVLVKRQAIDGNKEGLAFLSGNLLSLRSPPVSSYRAADQSTARPPAAPRNVDSVRSARPGAAQAPPDVPTEDARAAARQRAAAVPKRSSTRSPVKIGVSSAVGIEPLHVGFWAECPASWRETADFLWTLNGEPIGRGINGQKTLAEAGEHTLGVLIVTARGKEYRASRTIRVLPRLDPSGRAAREMNQ